MPGPKKGKEMSSPQPNLCRKLGPFLPRADEHQAPAAEPW